MNAPNSAIELVMRNGTPYRIQLCVEPETRHTPEYLKSQIAQALDSLSSQSRWQRFASPVNSLSDRQLDYLASLDGKDRVAWCASVCRGDQERGIGLARYVRLTDQRRVAEFALTVVDEYQGQGVGFELLSRLIQTAADNALDTLRGHVLRGNRHMLSLSRRFDAGYCTEDASFVTVEIAVRSKSASG